MRSFVRESLLIAGITGLVACTDTAPTSVDPGLAFPREVSAGMFSVGDLMRAAPGEPCRTGHHRDFDFWVGEWDVDAPPGSGSLAGVNYIRSEVDGCVIAEYWAGGGFNGMSLNAYDPRTGQWNQHWVDQNGVNLRMSGGLVGGAMVMQGPRVTPSGLVLIDRTTWAPVPGGLTQLWDISRDGGATFPIINFNGGYIAHPGAVQTPSSGSTACTPPAYGSADFMDGNWSVSALHGPEVGTSSISSELSHCLFVERFETRNGYGWKAFLSYGRVVQTWFNTMVDTEGRRLALSGAGQPGLIVVSGQASAPNGSDVNVRITYTQVSADEFTAAWATSTDGENWSTERELVYRRMN